MKRLTVIRFFLITLVIAVGTFWWGVLWGRGLAMGGISDNHQEPLVEPIRLLGGVGREAQNNDAEEMLADVARSGDGRTERKRPFDEVIAEAMTLPLDGILSPRQMAIASDLLKEVDDTDLPAALKLLESKERGYTKQTLRMILLSRWASLDGSGAANYVLENPGEHPNGTDWDHMGLIDLKDVISHWIESDPAAVFEWYKSNTDRLIENAFDVNDGNSLTTIFGALSLQNMDEAFAKLESLEDDHDRMFAMTGMLSASDTQQRGELMEKLDAIEDPQTRDEGYKMLMSQWASLDPEEAAAFVDNASHLDPETEEILTNAVSLVWMEDNPREGAKWLAENATSENRSARMVQAVNVWARQDPEEAAKWLGDFEPNLDIDNALSSLAMGVSHLEIEDRFEWLARITDDNKRNRALELIFQQWHARNPEQAEARLRSSNVPPNQAAEWIEQAQSRKIERIQP